MRICNDFLDIFIFWFIDIWIINYSLIDLWNLNLFYRGVPAVVDLAAMRDAM
jgi:hypothetical protein